MTRCSSVLTVAALVVLAGCSGATAPSPSTESCDEGAFVLGGGRTNQLSEFEHLNVTIPTVELTRSSTSSDKRVTNASGTLTNGTQVNVSVRRDRLKVKKRFTANGNASLQFTVEPTVVLRNGSYVLKSRLGGSGCGCC